MPLIFIGLVFVLSSGFALAQQPTVAVNSSTTNAGGPRIKFESTVHDFGKVMGDQLLKHEFVFTNVGSSRLTINVVRGGSVISARDHTQVEPGKTGVIPLQFNTAGASAEFRKQTTVVCNDPTQPSIVLEIKGTVWRPIYVTPQFAILNLTPESPSNAAIVKIVNNLEAPLSILGINNTQPAFAVELSTNEPGKSFQLLVKTVPPYLTNHLQGSIVIRTSSTNMPVIRVTAWANMQPTILAMPQQITLSAGARSNLITQTVWIRNNGTNNITVSDPTVSIRGVHCELTAQTPGRQFSVKLTFPAGFQLGPAKKAELKVKTSHPQFPVLTIPIRQS